MSEYLLYREKLIENDDTLKDFAQSVIRSVPTNNIKSLETEEYADEFMDLVSEIITDDISRTDINYEDLMYKYRNEIGDLLYEMENHGYDLKSYELSFFGDKAESTFNILLKNYIALWISKFD